MTRSLGDWLRHLETLHPKAIDLGLERCDQVYQRLGAPRPARQVWTVAGTNGKGSVTAYISALVAARGHAVGVYTSPHILRFNERIRINRVEATDGDIVAALEQVEAVRQDVSLTYFEFTTLAAMLLLHARGLDAAVLEIGLGGRLDAVNLVDPDCAVITPIGLDHQAFIGNDRETIAREKAGIIRAGKPVVIGDRDPPASLLECAAESGAPTLILGRDFDHTIGDAEWRYSGPGVQAASLPFPPLPGVHQLDNLATAVTATLQLLPANGEARGSMADGIRSVRLPGRLQTWPADCRLLLDVGHNPMAAAAVADYLADQDSGDHSCVLGMLEDKDVEGVVGALSGQVCRWFCAGLAGERGQSGAELARRVSQCLPSDEGRHASVQSFVDVKAALVAAREWQSGPGRVLVFGSFHTVADALSALERGRSSQP
jgi:dihydrofolate synthase/folylpolyglutamate synthase